MATTITSEEMERQRGYIVKLKALTARFSQENGRMMAAHTETYGCQQNENDTERLRGMLAEAGFGFCDSAEEADLVLYNTCAVRENAEQKVFGRLGILKHIKESRPDMTIAVCGCMVQQEHIAEKIQSVHEQVDLIFGTHALYRFPELLYETLTKKQRIVDTEDSDGKIAEGLPILRDDDSKAWVSIMYGCNNFCTYCIVPYVRGRERSRQPEDILNEIKGLVAAGVSEICLLGQNVNSYGKDLEEKIDFSDLVRMVDGVEGVRRIRFMTSHPKDFSEKLIQTMAECKKVCPQLHLPVQAGSDTVLKAMNRGYTKEEYLQKLELVKKRIPGIALSTDIIVGFPTETNADFEETLDVIRRAEYDSIFSFIYSPRKGTPAAELKPVLTSEEIHKNFNRLLEVQNEISLRKNKVYEGSVQEVLVDGISKNNDSMLSGRTASSKIVNFPGSRELKGKYVKVKITAAKTWSLDGELYERNGQ